MAPRMAKRKVEIVLNRKICIKPVIWSGPPRERTDTLTTRFLFSETIDAASDPCGTSRIQVVMSEKITILHIDHHPVFRYGIETLINAQPGHAGGGTSFHGTPGDRLFSAAKG